MGDIGSDTEAGLERVIGNYKKLKKRYPNHKLLELGTLDQDEKGIIFSESYYERFCLKDDKYAVQGYGRYAVELEKATMPSSLRYFQ